jgi:hypothetical protein
MRLACIVASAIFTGSCATNRNLTGSKTTVSHLSEITTLSEVSLVYSLPLTVFDVEIVTERIIEKPGPYSRYAEDLLGLRDVIKTESESWTITGITVDSHEELDPNEFYVVETGTILSTNALALKKSGLIMDLNPDLYNYHKSNFNYAENDRNLLNVYDLGSDEYFRQRRDTLYRVVSLDTAFVRIPYLSEKKQKLSFDQLAEKAAVRLMELRDGKHLILTGETNLFPQNEAAIKEINRLEKEYTELFVGKTMKEKRTFKYQVIPDRDNESTRVILCNFSEVTGPVQSPDQSGIPVVMEFIPEMKTRKLDIASGKADNSSVQRNDKLFYRVPDVVNVRMSIGEEVLDNSRWLIYQFGEIVRIPSNVILER